MWPCFVFLCDQLHCRRKVHLFGNNDIETLIELLKMQYSLIFRPKF